MFLLVAQEMLTPHSFQANLDVWSFHLNNPISNFPPYDTELISDGQLTLSDLDHFHKGVSLREKSPDSDRVPLDPPPEVTSEISQLVKQYTGTVCGGPWEEMDKLM